MQIINSAEPFETYELTTTRLDDTQPGVVIAVANDRACIVSCPTRYIDWLDYELRYKSATAAALESGWTPPTAADPDVEEEPQWDGFIRMLRKPKTKACWFPAGLTRFAHHICERRGLHFTLVDTRKRPEFGFPEPVTWPYPFRGYQDRAIEAAVAKGRGVIDIPPRGGKTAIGFEIQRRFALPTLWIAPTDRIVTQTVERAVELFGPGYVAHQVGVKGWEAAAQKQLVICTAATAVLLPQAFWDTRQAWFIDEFHHGAAKTYHVMAEKARHIYYRIGLTGTFFRSGDDELALHAILANRIAKIESRQLLAEGVLVPTRVCFVPIDGVIKVAKADGPSGLMRAGIYQYDPRNKLIAYSVQQLVRAGRRVLVLVGFKRQGEELASLIASGVPPARSGCHFKAVEFVSGSRNKSQVGEVIRHFTERKEVQVLIGTSVVGEGVDLPAADALVYASGGKAEVSLKQNAYRVCTADPGKKHAFIIDFADRHHRGLLQHSVERMQVYADDPVFTIDALSHSGELPVWFQKRLANIG